MILSYQSGYIGDYTGIPFESESIHTDNIEFRCFTIDFYRASRGACIINICFALLQPNRINFTVYVRDFS